MTTLTTTTDPLAKWAEYYAAKNVSELKHGYISGWTRREAHPFAQDHPQAT
jgi:hypothetical protein